MNKVDINGITVRYEIEGEGPWVMLSHSLTCDLTMWDELAAVLAPTFTVLRYDTRGHGGTSLPNSAPQGAYSFADLTADVIGLLDALDIESTHFVGLSMGGMIGQHLALAAPQRVDKLVIASSTSRIPAAAGPLWDERIATVRAEGCAALVDSTLGRWFTPGFRAAQPEAMQRIGGLIRNTPAAGYIGCAGAIRTLDITAQIGAISAPTLVIAGAEDPGTPPAMSEVIAATIPAAQLEIIPSASHLSCIEQPETFHRLVAGFLNTDF
ncbi:MAG: 3-oxoadipate enol-lactonase [Rhodocyclales bacterium RIFCSPLOWO2_02_FULL_63_24]|nr:MAG: 3-oxoadipate enol-lactonase [Rhodocyclales bacterium GWA2_65_19]OHC68713.1 MAG: 3-oxoadipate enol-lactonase [Rhodocyclales bacterium RIFCSPLOWO2_02_FULL_63_24]